MFFELDAKRDHVAVIDDEGASLSYSDLASFSDEFYNVIKARTLIFILSENNVGSLACYTACLVKQVVPLILSSNIDSMLLSRLIETYKPEYIWAPLRLNVADYSSVSTKYSYRLLRTGLRSFSLHSNLSLLLSTSGSTGSPKLVRHSYQNVGQNAKNVAEFFGLTDSDRPLAMLPMHYTMGLSVVTSHLYAGATILLTKASVTESTFWKFLKEQKATSLTGVPYTFEALQKLRFFKMDLPHLTLITQGGGKLKEDLFKLCSDYATQTNKRFIATYGQTEGTARMAFLPADLASEKTGSIGKAIPNGKLYLVDDKGKVIDEPEAIGEMVYEGANVTLGYALSGDDLMKGDERNGVLRTGDVARRDSDGCYFVVGRVSRFLKIYGIRISLDEIDQLIKSNFDVDCVSAGTDDMMIIYITKKELSEAIKTFIVEKTGLYHKAFRVEFKDVILRNEYGKVIF